ncbi:unnamed protein product [Peronospora belbahrii]|uniref:Myb-like domain-containing protein n=1 Tax=Peronospora belbahrii TaxID=622444 RepID=A0AAU9L6P9_9STRA|nr:unnamed protein product [Peronospora belbahrii]
MISPKVMSELHQAKLVPTQFTVPKPGEHAWSPAEQRRFWEAIQRFPQGPWTAIADYVGSKSTRQAMTHAQKLRQKLSRWKRRVRSDSVGSTGSNSSASATVTTLDDGSNDGQSPPISPTRYSEIAELSMMGHIEEENGEQKDMDEDDCEPRRIKTEVKCKVQQFQDHNQVHDAPNDRYLEHLLSDIEPVLEHVAHFTNGSHRRGNDETTRPVSTTDYGNEQAAYFTHYASMATSENKTMELSTWNQQRQNSTDKQHQNSTDKQHQYHHQYSSPSTAAAMCYAPTETSHQHNYHHL